MKCKVNAEIDEPVHEISDGANRKKIPEATQQVILVLHFNFLQIFLLLNATTGVIQSSRVGEDFSERMKKMKIESE